MNLAEYKDVYVFAEQRNGKLQNVALELLGKAGSPTSVFKSFPKQLKPAGQTFEVTPEEAVELIVNKLKEKHII